MDENIDDDISLIDAKLFNLESRLANLENEEKEIEAYRRYFLPSKIKQYILKLNELRNTRTEKKFYPLSNNQALEVQSNMFNNDLELEAIFYNNDDRYLEIIANIISNQGLSGFNFLNNLDANIDLNKPIILYYGIMQLGVYFSNLHYDFTHCNNNINNYDNINQFYSHGIPSKLFKEMSSVSTIENILSIELPILRRGVCSRFFLGYDPRQVNHFFTGLNYNLFNSLSCFFKGKMKEDFENEFALRSQNQSTISEIFGIYLTSFILSMLSRYRLNLWVKLIDKNNNISFYINYFLKFAKQTFLRKIFRKLFNNENYISRYLTRTST